MSGMKRQSRNQHSALVSQISSLLQSRQEYLRENGALESGMQQANSQTQELSNHIEDIRDENENVLIKTIISDF